jgi:hypothetical protein
MYGGLSCALYILLLILNCSVQRAIVFFIRRQAGELWLDNERKNFLFYNARCSISCLLMLWANKSLQPTKKNTSLWPGTAELSRLWPVKEKNRTVTFPIKSDDTVIYISLLIRSIPNQNTEHSFQGQQPKVGGPQISSAHCKYASLRT